MAVELGNQDASSEVLQIWRDSFEVLDDVFASFVSTNISRGVHAPWDQIIHATNRHRRYFTYSHLSIPYRATTFVLEGGSSDWLNIKLNCNGFTWPSVPQRCTELDHPRHNATGWIVLPDGIFPQYVFPTISRYFDDADGLVIYYARDARRVDMKFFYDGDRPHVIVTFEMGYPEFEDYLDNKYMSRRQT